MVSPHIVKDTSSMMNENGILNTRYRLEKKIGQGGFAQVFLATDLLLKRTIAIKILNSDLGEDYNFLERFGAEARAVAAFDHPNILPVYDYGQTEGTAYLVMPYVEGGTLGDRLRRERKLSLVQANGYLQQVAAALDYAHKRNVVHRDIKPQNMLLRSEDNRLLLTDFGISKVLSSASAQSVTGLMGTLSYMAPEQLSGNVGIGTDIYALGCVLFQMLSGAVPYTGPTEQVIMGHLTGPIPSLVERSEGQIGSAVQAVIERALAKRPEDRYASAGKLAQAFAAAVAADAPAETTQAFNTLPLFAGPTEYETTRVIQPPLSGPDYSPSSMLTQPSGGVLPTPLANGNGGANPPGYAYRTPPGRSGPSKTLLALIGGLALLLVAVIVLLVVLLNSSRPASSPTSVPVAVVSLTSSAAPTTLTSPTTVSDPPTTTTVAVTSVAVLTTLAPTVAPTLTPPPVTTGAQPTPAPIAPTTVPIVPTVPPAPPLPPTIAPTNQLGIKQALDGLPGPTSSFVILPNGQTIDSNGGQALPSASTIKLWIAASVLEQAKAGAINLADRYTIKREDVAPGTGILKDRVGSQFTFAELITNMLVYSDNGIANILVNRLGGSAPVNKYAAANGYGCTRLQRRLGYPGEGPENLTCAHDAAIYIQRLTQHGIVDAASSDLILQALQNRLAYPQDQNFFGPKLPPGTNYRHVSGTGDSVRNEVGFIATGPDPYNKPLIIAIYTNNSVNPTGAEGAIATTVNLIYTTGKI